MKIRTYAWGLAFLTATSSLAMQNPADIGMMGNPAENRLQPLTSIPQTILCSRLTLQEHQQLATASEVKLWKKCLSDGDLKTLLPILQGNPSLTKLDLFQNNIGPNGAKILASLPSLRELNLEGNNAGDEGAAAFEANTSLKIQKLYPYARKIVVLSLGTGEGLPDRTMNRLGDAGVLGWAPQIASHLMSNAAEVVAQTIRGLINQDPRLEYIRIQAALANSETGMDNVSVQNIQSLMSAAETTIRNHRQEIKAITKILLEKMLASFAAPSA